jgi:CBS domain-containing protein
MILSDVMTKSVEVIDSDATIFDAAQAMKDLDIGVVPVCENEKLIGMVTDRDIVVRGVADKLDPRTTPVKDILTRGVVFCSQDEPLASAAEKMAAHQVRRVLVVDSEENLVGLVSLGDLARADNSPKEVAETLETVSLPQEEARKLSAS